MDNCIKILVFDEEELTKTLIENYLKDLSFPYTLEKFNEFDESYIKDFNDEKIIIVNINKMNSEKLLNSVFIYSGKKSNFIIISYDKSTDLNVKVLRAGAADFLLKPLIKSDFLYTVKKIYKQNILIKKTDNTSRLYTAVSLDMKAGKTNLLINTAKETADLSKEKVLLIDFNESVNDISSLLNINVMYNPNFYFNNLSDNNAEKLLNTIPNYKSSSLYVMSNKYFKTCTDKINLENFDNVIEILKSHFKYIFIDMNKDNEQLNNNVIRVSDMLFYVVVPNINTAKKTEEDITSKYKNKKIYIIFNKYEYRYEPNIEKIKEAVELPLTVKIPKSYIALAAAKEGNKTLKEVNPELDIVKVYNEFAKYIIKKD